MSKSVKLREFLARLSDYGVIIHPNPARGKGSELVVYKPTNPDNLAKGPIFTITNHGMGKTVGMGLMLACLRRFGIDKNEFLDGL
ncbi:MAG: hypothetical protein A2Z18_05555 [Armatimonadetes bacterium RBG_16_58_9]|nr:MAG: hypothetical protein A2Z18_05555 [Armatimonadetes bacterium RBG_16_58_9]